MAVKFENLAVGDLICGTIKPEGSLIYTFEKGTILQFLNKTFNTDHWVYHFQIVEAAKDCYTPGMIINKVNDEEKFDMLLTDNRTNLSKFINKIYEELKENTIK